jgi:hypothetical protein
MCAFDKTTSIRYLPAAFAGREGALGRLTRLLPGHFPRAANAAVPRRLDELITVAR